MIPPAIAFALALGDLLLMPHDDGCRSLLSASGTIVKASDPPPKPGDNNWACLTGPADKGRMVCVMLAAEAEQHLLARSPFGGIVMIVLNPSALASDAGVFTSGTVSLEGAREVLVLSPGAPRQGRPYVLRSEVFHQLGDGRFGYHLKACAGTAADLPKNVKDAVYMEIGKLQQSGEITPWPRAKK